MTKQIIPPTSINITSTTTDDDNNPYRNVYITDSTDDLSWGFAGIRRDQDPFDVSIQLDKIGTRIAKIEHLLGVLTRNNHLENKYTELKKIADTYQKLEKELLEKEKMWEILQK